MTYNETWVRSLSDRDLATGLRNIASGNFKATGEFADQYRAILDEAARRADDRDRGTLTEVDIADLVGAGEIAKRFNTTKNVVVNWAARYADFPKPIVDHLAMGRIWSWREVAAWLDANK